MKYFQVNATSDQTKCRVIYKHQILVANELYTEREVQKAINNGWVSAGFVHKHMTAIQCSPKNTHFFFGARFQNNN